MAQGIRVTYGGVTYMSLNELCRAKKLQTSSLTKLLKKGMSLDEAVSTLEELKHKREIEYNGVVYKSLSAMARAHKMKPSLVGSRLRRGFSLEDALDPDFSINKSKVGTKVVLEGDKYNSISSLAKDMFIDSSLVVVRLRRGFSLEQAVDPDFGLKYDKRRKDTSVEAYASRSGLSASTIRGRLRLGFTIEQATDPDFKSKYDRRINKKIAQ